MPAQIVWDSEAINYVQPDDGGGPVGTVLGLGVDANLNQYTDGFGSAGTSCCDVDGLTLWSLDDAGYEALFTDAGAAAPSSIQNPTVFVSQDGTKLFFYMTGIVGVSFYVYLGISDISATGAVAPPVLTNFIRFKVDGPTVFTAVGIWEVLTGGVCVGLLMVTRNSATDKLQFWPCPSIAELEGGDFKGSHPGCNGILEIDQGPTVLRSWTSAEAEYMGFSTNLIVHDGTVTENPVGFYSSEDERFYFVIPKAWMANTAPFVGGVVTEWADDYPDGGVFYLDLSDLPLYSGNAWPTLEVTEVQTLSTGVVAAPDAFVSGGVPALPWTEEYTRLADGGDTDGWETSYGGRPFITYDTADGLPVLLFGAIDGNEAYEDTIGTGERVYYAKIRAYKWTGSVFNEFDTAEGIVLRDGDLGYSGYNFDHPDSQNVFLYDGDIYFQITQWFGTSGDSRSVLTRFGRFIESETRQTQGSGRVRYVPRT